MTKRDLVYALEPFADDVSIVVVSPSGAEHPARLFYQPPQESRDWTARLVVSQDIPAYLDPRQLVPLRTP